MKPIQKIKGSPHYSRLRESVQYRFDRRQFLIISVLFGLIFLMFLPLMILAGDTSNGEASFAMCILLMLGLLLAVVFYAYSWLGIFLYIDSYIFCQVRLDQPHAVGRGGVKFTVEFTDRHGTQLKRDTSAMFSSQWEPLLEDYNNKTVLIGYNEETDRVVLIQRLDA